MGRHRGGYGPPHGWGRPSWQQPYWWTRRKIDDHPAVIVGAVIGGIIGSVLGPAGTIAGAGAGGAIGHNLDQPSATKVTTTTEEYYED